MHTIIQQLRMMQFTAHNGHQLVVGATAPSDHKFLGKLYPAYDAAYDSLVELILSEGDRPDVELLTKAAAADVTGFTTTDDCFRRLLSAESTLRSMIDSTAADESFGVQNFLSQLAEDSLRRTYHLNARLG
jgi:hypothetical protein